MQAMESRGKNNRCCGLLSTVGLWWIVAVGLGCVSRSDATRNLEAIQGEMLDGVVKLQDSSYEKYLLTGPRPYHFFALFTATPSQYKCEKCKAVAPEFIVLAESFLRAERKADDGKPVFFGVLDYPQGQKTFAKYDATSAPFLVYVQPTDMDMKKEDVPAKVKLDGKNRYDFYQKGIHAEAMAEYVSLKTGVKFDIQRSMVFLYLVVLFLFGSLLFLLRFVLLNFDYFMVKIRRKSLWMAISLMFYGLSVSGMVYCIIRNPPPFSMERNGVVKYFHPAGRQQFVYEGLIVGGYNILAGIFIILLSDFAIYIKNTQNRYLFITLCILGFLVMHNLLRSAYVFKNPWYGNRDGLF